MNKLLHSDRSDAKHAFSLIELVVVMAIIGLMATIAIPALRSLFPRNERTVFLQNLNAVTTTALSNAVLSSAVTRIVFDFNEHLIYCEEQVDKKTSSTDASFKRLDIRYVSSEIALPDMFSVQQFYIDTKDEMRLSVGDVKKDKVWFYVIPEGTSQAVIINMIDNQRSDEDNQFSFVINPFTCQFTYYEKFTQPS